MVEPLQWYLSVQVLGVLAFPLAFALFSRLPDRGYTFAKPLALVLVSYTWWLLGLTQLIPTSRLTLAGILLLGAVFSAWILRQHFPAIREHLRVEWRAILVAEGVFLVFFVLWLAIGSESPAINHTEKPMDFAFMNAVLQSPSFPPEDPWLSGHPISYYYFGHLMMASVTKLAAIPSAIGYNVAVSFIPALLGMAAFGLVYNLVRLSRGGVAAALGFGLAAPALLMLVGNLEGTLEFLHVQGWGSDGFWRWVGIKGLEAPAAAGSGVFPEQSWWWWRATRVIDTLAGGQSLDYTITEFPFFSFILGDLHPHVIALPFLVMFLGVALNLFQSQERLGLAWLRQHPVESFTVAMLLGSLAFINIWDFPVFVVVLGLVVFAKNYGGEPAGRERPDDLTRAALNTGLFMVPLVGVAYALFIPFYLGLSTQASGILPVSGFGSRPFLFFVVMGLPFVFGISFLLRQMTGLTRLSRHDHRAILLILVVSPIPWLLWAVIILFIGAFSGDIAASGLKIGSRSLLVLPGLAIAGLAWFSALQRLRGDNQPLVAFPLLLLAAAFYLLVGAELFFLVDFFGNRMNTVFKAYFQSWLLLSLAGAYGLYYWYAHWQPGPIRFRVAQYAWVTLVVVLLAASLYYPVGAVIDRTGILDPRHTAKDNSLDGLKFVQQVEPGEYAAIAWLRDQAPRGRIVEAVGDDYSPYGRISASTGLPTILGWKGHERQWRGTAQLFEGREEDVALIYQSSDGDTVRRLLEKYDVRYVYVGSRERASYGKSNLSEFSGFLKTAHTGPGVIIYERIEGDQTTNNARAS